VGKALGADVVVNVREQDAVGPWSRPRPAAWGGTHPGMLRQFRSSCQAIEMTRRGARISFIGDPHTLTTINLRRFVLEIYGPPASGVRAWADCQRSLALLAAGKIVAKTHDHASLPLEQINEHSRPSSTKGGALKVIVPTQRVARGAPPGNTALSARTPSGA